MEAAGITVADIPGDGPIRQHHVREFLRSRERIAIAPEELIANLVIGPDSVILYGAAEQGLVVLDCLRAIGAQIPLCFIDDHAPGTMQGNLPVLRPGSIELLFRRGARLAHVCIGAPEPRLRIAEHLKRLGFSIISAVHPAAVVSQSALLGEGVYIAPGVVIGPQTEIGDYCQINNNATIPHHVKLGKAVRVSDGANLAGGVIVGDRSYLGLGVTINTGCHIGADVTVVSGTSVFETVPSGTIVRYRIRR